MVMNEPISGNRTGRKVLVTNVKKFFRYALVEVISSTNTIPWVAISKIP